MNKAEAVYEFINQFAYFACSGIIVMENYTVSDADKFSDLIQAFEVFMKHYNKLTDMVEKGNLSEEAADSILRSSIKLLRNRSVDKFFKSVKKDILPKIGKTEKLEKAINKISKDVKGNKETDKVFLELIETLRKEEESILKEAKT